MLLLADSGFTETYGIQAPNTLPDSVLRIQCPLDLLDHLAVLCKASMARPFFGEEKKGNAWRGEIWHFA